MPSLRCQDRQNQCHLPIIPHTIELCIPVKKYPTPAYMPKWGLLLFHVKILLYPVYYDIFPRSSDCIRLFQYHVQPLHHLSTPDILRLPLIDHPEIILLDPVTVNLLQQFPKASLVQIRKMPPITEAVMITVFERQIDHPILLQRPVKDFQQAWNPTLFHMQ